MHSLNIGRFQEIITALFFVKLHLRDFYSRIHNKHMALEEFGNFHKMDSLIFFPYMAQKPIEICSNYKPSMKCKPLHSLYNNNKLKKRNNIPVNLFLPSIICFLIFQEV